MTRPQVTPEDVIIHKLQEISDALDGKKNLTREQLEALEEIDKIFGSWESEDAKTPVPPRVKPAETTPKEGKTL